MVDLGSVEWLIRTPDVQVRVLTLEPGHGTPWHFHSDVTDHVFALDDGVEVSLRDPEARVRLSRGERCDVAPRRVHRVSNNSGAPARYLLVQGGRYDFNELA